MPDMPQALQACIKCKPFQAAPQKGHHAFGYSPFLVTQVCTGTREVRADAAVNSGNTLAAWAELLPPAQAVQMLTSAQQAYEAALTQEEDAAVRHPIFPAFATHIVRGGNKF